MKLFSISSASHIICQYITSVGSGSSRSSPSPQGIVCETLSGRKEGIQCMHRSHQQVRRGGLRSLVFWFVALCGPLCCSTGIQKIEVNIIFIASCFVRFSASELILDRGGLRPWMMWLKIIIRDSKYICSLLPILLLLPILSFHISHLHSIWHILKHKRILLIVSAKTANAIQQCLWIQIILY